MKKIRILFDVEPSLDILLRLPLFQDFSRDALRLLLNDSKYEIREYGKYEILHMQNEVCQFMDIILEGKVIVQNIDEKGNVLIIDTFVGGDIIGANLMFSSKNVYPMTVIASLRTLVLMMKKELILEMSQGNTCFMLGLLNEISDKTIILTEKINAISRKTIRQCILDFLQQEQSRQESSVIKLPISKKELAERLGIPRSSLGRELIKMRKDEILEYDAWTITLKEKLHG